MHQLIEALQILVRYQDRPYPTHCGHDILIIMGITYDEVSEEDRAALDTLGFFWSTESNAWASYRYGSA